MKPPETVTLINLDGTLVFPADTRHKDYMLGSFLMANNSEHGWYAIEFSAGFSRQLTFLPDNAKILEERENVIFLNNQLTLTRKGEETGNWDDLNIYQATLGKYWEVPVMQYDQPTIDYLNLHKICHIVRRLETKISMPYIINGEDFVGEQIVKNTDDDRCILVTPSVYLKHYPDVFSKLTPWNGE